MINPFLTGLTFLLWLLTIVWGAMYFPFAFGTTVYWIAVTLFFTPTIPRGALPPLDDIYARAICNCLKTNQLAKNEEDTIPAIACEATHILYDLDVVWKYDTILANCVDKNQSSDAVVKYLTMDPLERSDLHQLASNSSNILPDNPDKPIKLHVKDRELITSHIKRVRTIPLSIPAISYYQPIFNLEAMIQTFIHFPLSAMKAVLTGVDLTMYFPAPRGAQFFFESQIIGIRQGGGGIDNPDPTTISHNANCDLLLDIQTVIMIDRNRLSKLYRDELDEDEEESRKAEEIKQLETEEKQLEAIETVEKQKIREKSRRVKKFSEIPQELITVSRIVNTFTYHNSINTKTYKLSTQDHLPYDNNTFDRTFFKESQPSSSSRQTIFPKQPQLTVNTSSQDGVNFTHLIGNAHPRMTTGFASTLFGYNSTNNNQLDCTYALLLALSAFHADKQDDLTSGVNQSRFASLVRDDNVVDQIEHPSQTIRTKPTPSQPIYPYRILLQTVETISAPATIHFYMQNSNITPPQTQIQHRGYEYTEHQQKRRKSDYVSVAEQLSTEAFPQFQNKQILELTIRDTEGGQSNETVWARGMVLTEPRLEQV